MQIKNFISVGENIHCTRILKVGGKSVHQVPGGGYAISYKSGGEARQLPVPKPFMDLAAWKEEKVRHCAVAIWQGNYGNAQEKAAGIDYIQSLAREQEAAGANYLDINVDEFSTDQDEKIRMIQWTVDVAQKAVKIPVSIDSSNTGILSAGLDACDKSRARPMVNSVSLERTEAIKIAASKKAVVIASAAGEGVLPSGTEERLQNLARLMPMLRAAGFGDPDIHVDPLVFPISTDQNNGKGFLDAVTAVRKTYGSGIHIVAGLSNVSFGMPNRKLINQVFSYMACEAGADGGIVDPLQINAGILNGLDSTSKAFELARALLSGEDEFGMNYISACRDGSI